MPFRRIEKEFCNFTRLHINYKFAFCYIYSVINIHCTWKKLLYALVGDIPHIEHWIVLLLTFYHMSILWKMAVFIEKPPVTSSNCYKTKINDSILMKLGTNVNWTIPSVTACSILIFLLQWQPGDVSKLRKITIYYIVFFQSKLISKCCNFSMHWGRIKGFSAFVTCYLRIDLMLFLACHMSKWTICPLQTPQNRRGYIHPLVTPWCNIFMWGRADKMISF
jgi:hypothetical protein